MKVAALVCLLASWISASAVEEELEKKKPCCGLRQAEDESCGVDGSGCKRTYVEKLDFYHTKPVIQGSDSGPIRGTWTYYDGLEGSQADDGIFTAGCHGGVVDSRVFQSWSGPSPNPYRDNYKFLIFAMEEASVPKFGDLTVEFEGSGETFKGDQNKFPKEITQTNDLRSVNVGFITRDELTGLEFNWLLTNDRVYVVYTRHFDQYGMSQAAGFTFALPVKMRKPGDWHSMKTVLHGTAKQVSYHLDGHEVFRISKVGYLLDRQYMLVDYGGAEAVLFPTFVKYGFGTFTMVNAYPACKRSDHCCDCKFPTLRQALSNTGVYDAFLPSAIPYNPLLGFPSPAVFFQPNDDPSLAAEDDFIWGQGAKLYIKKLVVYQDVCARKC